MFRGRATALLLVGLTACSSAGDTGAPDAGPAMRCSPDPSAAPGAIAFEDVSLAAQLPQDVAEDCAAIADIDRDGHLDLLLATPTALHFYWGRGDFSFETTTLNWPGVQGCLLVDLDEDGRLDLVLPTQRPPELHLQAEARSFTDATSRLGPAPGDARPSRGLAAGDIDGDGRLDLFLGRSARPEQPLTCTSTPQDTRCDAAEALAPSSDRLLLRQADGQFSDASERLPASPDGNALAAVVFDLDGDAFPDILVGNDFGENAAWLLAGDGFTDQSAQLSLDGYNHAMGIAVADFDGDGRQDLYITDIGADRLFRGADGGFADVSESSGVAAATADQIGWGVAAEDFDNDGDVDLFVGNSYGAQPGGLEPALSTLTTDPQAPVTHAAAQQGSTLLTNDGSGRFSAQWHTFEVSDPSLFFTVFTPVAAGDIDGDGAVDLLEGNPWEGHRLWRNVTPQRGQFLQLVLEGPAGNPDAVGARVEVETPCGRQRRIVTAGSAGGHGWRRLHFGLGTAQAATVRIHWPGFVTPVEYSVTPGTVRLAPP